MTPIVRTTGGEVRGIHREVGDGVHAFLGIPYAAEVFGEFRFRAPGPAPRWDGVLAATTTGPTAPQLPGGHALPGVNLTPMLGDWAKGAQVLNLTVWTPDPGAGGLPVLVFLHGGGFVGGSGSLDVYEGSRFTTRGAVLVTVNYRLGAEGFLPLPGGDSNVGLRDQLAALRWVQDNIAAFGGDPGRVTVFGESAGAMSIVCLLGSPAASGLLRRAIIQSGSIHIRGAAYGPRLADALSRVLGVPATRAGFASVDPAEIIKAQAELAGNPSLIDLTGLPDLAAAVALAQFMPMLDEDILPSPPMDAMANGSSAGIDLLAGTNTDEMNLWLVPTGAVAAVTDESLSAMVTATRTDANPADPDAHNLVAAYRRALPDASAGELYAAIVTDGTFRRPTLDLLDLHAATGGRCFCYEFTEPAVAMDGKLGACHAIEVPYVFDNLHADGLAGEGGLLGDEPSAELAARTQQAWVDFADTGDPGWAAYTVPDRPVQRIGRAWTLVEDPFRAVRDAW